MKKKKRKYETWILWCNREQDGCAKGFSNPASSIHFRLDYQQLF
jgi:hypothetical protein